MIGSFKHKGLKNLFLNGQHQGLHPEHISRLRNRLAVIHAAEKVSDIDMPGYHLHPLKGVRDTIWSVRVTGNWRLTFEFVDGDAYILDYKDYH